MNPVYERIYGLAPIWAQNVLTTRYGQHLMAVRYRQVYRDSLTYYRTKDYSRADLEFELQARELRRLLQHAKANSPYYASLYAGLDLKEVRAVKDLPMLPILEKEELRANMERVWTIPLKDGNESFTGGTTGKSLRVVFTSDDTQRRLAYLDAFKYRCGVDPFRARKATFSGRSLATGLFQGKRKVFWRDNRANNQRLYSTFDLQEENLPAYVADLNRYRPTVLNGFVSAIHQVAAFMLQRGIKPGFPVQAVFTTSETLLPHHKEVIERAFETTVFDQYASGEGAPFITTCPKGRLHYNIDTGVIESVDFGDGPEMLVTSFTSYGTPLIRYRIGDGITLGQGSCECGSCHPLVERINGRAVDYLYSPERGKVSLCHLADVIKGLPNAVREMQFVQDRLDAIVVNMVVDPATYTSQSERTIESAMRFRFGSTMKIAIRRVESIPRERSGKFRIIKRSVTPSSASAGAVAPQR